MFQNCTTTNNTHMECLTPNLADGLKHILFSISRSGSRSSREIHHQTADQWNLNPINTHYIHRRAADGPTFNDDETKFYAGFVLDGVEEFRNISTAPKFQYGQLLVYPDPVYYPFHEEDAVREFFPVDDEFIHIKVSRSRHSSARCNTPIL